MVVQAVFDTVITSYYNTIKTCQKRKPTPRSPQTGAIFFAVYRGKVSEGLDFIDDNARAVIAVGIPYPALGDQPIALKKDFNDRHAKAKNLLLGHQWYEAQAFRAMNQALGRCIRHRHDWGAVILLDHRFCQQPRTVNQLSKWIRKDVKTCWTFAEAMNGLRDFMSSMQTEINIHTRQFDQSSFTSSHHSFHSNDLIYPGLDYLIRYQVVPENKQHGVPTDSHHGSHSMLSVWHLRLNQTLPTCVCRVCNPPLTSPKIFLVKSPCSLVVVVRGTSSLLLSG